MVGFNITMIKTYYLNNQHTPLIPYYHKKSFVTQYKYDGNLNVLPSKKSQMISYSDGTISPKYY